MFTENQKKVIGKVFLRRYGENTLSFKVEYPVDCIPGKNRAERVIAVEQRVKDDDKPRKAISLPAQAVWRLL